MRNMLWMPAIALASACSMLGGSTKSSDTVQAQNAAGTQYQRAADAQKRAADEQGKAEQANRDVQEKQKELADAQARARGQQLKARQAQEDAQRLAQEATQAGQQHQQQAAELQQSQHQQAAQKLQDNQSWTEQHEVEGEVLQASGDSVKVKTRSGETMNLGLSESTAVTQDGRMIAAERIQPGSDVRASYQMVDGRASALKVDVKRNLDATEGADKSAMPAEPASTEPKK